VIALADRAQARLHRRYWRLVTHGKAHNKAVTAVARELSGFSGPLFASMERQKGSGASVG
jgi:transposase